MFFGGWGVGGGWGRFYLSFLVTGGGGGVFIGLLLGVTKLTVLTEAERRTGPNMSLH